MTKVHPKPKSYKSIIIIVLEVLFVLWLFPAPFKPSPYPFLYTFFAKQSLNKSTDPVFLPSGEFRQNSSFSAAAGWRNAYEVLYNANREGVNDQFVHLLQLGEDSDTVGLSEGPPVQEIDNYKAAVNSRSCVIVDVEARIRVCRLKYIHYLIRDLEGGGHKIAVATPLYESTRSPDTYVFDANKSPNDLYVRVVRSLEPIPVQEAKATYFKGQF